MTPISAATSATWQHPVESCYGFGTAETLRRAFHRHLNVAPSEDRDRFKSVKELS